jgi:hypothetical protein
MVEKTILSIKIYLVVPSKAGLIHFGTLQTRFSEFKLKILHANTTLSKKR